ncbi:MAG: hypothetical protein HY825_12965 [Acidobacteria bacterium]|nr:hypothetical protein [Acidobacteriota bacterium]
MKGRLLLLASLGVLVALSLGCGTNGWDEENDLVVINDTRCNLRVFVDGHEAFVVRDHTAKSLEDIGDGRHVLEALDEDGVLVERRSIRLDQGEDYYWRIGSCS